VVVDVLRYALAVLGLVLAASSAAGGVYAATWDQGTRFAVMFGYSAVTISGQLDNLGNPATWRTWALAPKRLDEVGEDDVPTPTALPPQPSPEPQGPPRAAN
jgi:hypothetical protein